MARQLPRYVEVETDTRWPGYAVLQVGHDDQAPLYIPLCVDHPGIHVAVTDAFLANVGRDSAVTAFVDETAVWAFVAKDYASVHTDLTTVPPTAADETTRVAADET